MNKKSLAFGLLCMTVLPQIALAAAPAFHRASSEPEKALDTILMKEKNEAEMSNYILRKDAGKSDSAYSGMFTPAYKKAVLKAQAKECGKNAGDQCGLEFSPITCAQDTTDSYYMYHTVTVNKKMATIAYSWPNETDSSATYKLVKEGGQWKIDGVRCGVDGHAKFNMK